MSTSAIPVHSLLTAFPVGHDLATTVTSVIGSNMPLDCSGAENASFAEVAAIAGVKRSANDAFGEHELLEGLYCEVKRLKGLNDLLMQSCTCFEQKAQSAAAEKEKLQNLVLAMQPHKESFGLHPVAASLASSVASNQGTSFMVIRHDSGLEEDPTEKYLAIEHSPCRSQPNTNNFSLTPCKEDKRRAQSARPAMPSGCPEEPQDKLSRLPSRLEDDPRTAPYAAMVAAALAFNKGSPAAALVDLLQLAVSRQRAAAKPTTLI